MAHIIKHSTPEDAMKYKNDAELEHELRVLLCMDNGGGALANDIINELDRRATEREKYSLNEIIKGNKETSLDSTTKLDIDDLEDEEVDTTCVLENRQSK